MPVASLGSTEQEPRRAQSLAKGNFPNAMVKARRKWTLALTTGALNHPSHQALVIHELRLWQVKWTLQYQSSMVFQFGWNKDSRASPSAIRHSHLNHPCGGFQTGSVWQVLLRYEKVTTLLNLVLSNVLACLEPDLWWECPCLAEYLSFGDSNEHPGDIEKKTDSWSCWVAKKQTLLHWVKPAGAEALQITAEPQAANPWRWKAWGMGRWSIMEEGPTPREDQDLIWPQLLL